MLRSGREDGRDDEVLSGRCEDSADSVPDLKSDEVSESTHGNPPLPSETNLVQNADFPVKEIKSELEWPQRDDKPVTKEISAKETDLRSTSELGGSQRVLEPSNCDGEAQIVSEHGDLQCPKISENMMMQQVSSTQAGESEIGLQPIMTDSHPSSSTIPYNITEFQVNANKRTFPSRYVGRHLYGFGNHKQTSSSGTPDRIPSLSEEINHMNYLLHYKHCKPVDIPDKLKSNSGIDKLRLYTGIVDSIDDFGSSYPILKKNKLNIVDDYGYKPCNCTQSRCLKLYCRCFAEQSYCSEFCSCQGCLNNIEHEETVLAKARKLASQNEHAFSPKIAAISTNNPWDNMFTGKHIHIKGCSCKNSRCLQNYCECYKFRVGCSDLCRCNGCQNSFGQKGGESEIDVKPTLQQNAPL